MSKKFFKNMPILQDLNYLSWPIWLLSFFSQPIRLSLWVTDACLLCEQYLCFWAIPCLSTPVLLISLLAFLTVPFIVCSLDDHHRLDLPYQSPRSFVRVGVTVSHASARALAAAAPLARQTVGNVAACESRCVNDRSSLSTHIICVSPLPLREAWHRYT